MFDMFSQFDLFIFLCLVLIPTITNGKLDSTKLTNNFLFIIILPLTKLKNLSISLNMLL